MRRMIWRSRLGWPRRGKIDLGKVSVGFGGLLYGPMYIFEVKELSAILEAL